MVNTGIGHKLRRTQKDYSLAFKLQVVSEVEKGEISQKQALKKYGIQGSSTITVWLRKHGVLDWGSNKSMGKKNKPSPNKKIRELEARIKRLEGDKEILNRAIDIADDMFSTDIRKKFLPLSLKASEDRQGEDNTPSSE
jgi:transposase